MRLADRCRRSTRTIHRRALSARLSRALGPVALLLACGTSGRVTSTPTSPRPPSANLSTPAATAAAAKPRKLDPRIDPDNLQARLTPYVDSIGAGFGPAYRASGIVVVSAAGRRIYERAFGRANYELDLEIDADTSFRIGNLTKTFTAFAILKLADEGRLELSDPIGRHLPDYPAAGKHVTIEQLLRHTSGLPSAPSGAHVEAGVKTSPSPRDLMASFWERPLEFEPGTDFRFSDSGYVVLGAIVEKVSGKPFAAYLREEVLEPNGLETTTLGEPQGSQNLAVGYRADAAGQRRRTQDLRSARRYSESGLRSSANDLVRWAEALGKAEQSGSPAFARLGKPGRGDYSPAGFVRSFGDLATIEMAGEADGFIADLLRAPALDLTVVVLANSSAFNAAPVARVALACALGQPVAPLEKSREISLAPEVSARFLGTYRLSESAVVELRRRKVPKKALRAMRSVRIYSQDGTLFFKPIGQAPVSMSATSDSQFVLMGGKASVEIPLPPDDSEATDLILRQGPLELLYVRRARIRGKPSPPEEDPLGED